jgi:hypothetical protein
MKKLLFLFAITGLVLTFACERANNDQASTPDYYQLNTGNYWVYEMQRIVNDTIIETLPINDSIYIEKDTLINNIKYSKFTGTSLFGNLFPYSYYLRDSSGYLVDHYGKVYFSADNRNDTLNAYTVADVIRISYKMDLTDSLISTPAGSFSCLFSRCTITALKSYLNFDTRTQGDFRADGIGVILSTNVNASDYNLRLKRSLLRYRVVKN